MLAMTISQSLSLAVTASVLAVSWVMPAPATELPVPGIHNATNFATPARKPAQGGLFRIASETLPPSADNGPHWTFPIIVGVAY
jgi:hypothetical protein